MPLPLPALVAMGLALSACTGAPLQAPAGGGGGPAGYVAQAATDQLILRVAGDRHLVRPGASAAFGTVPFEVVAVEARAFNDAAKRVPFPAIAGATLGRYGWKYARLTPETARGWTGDAGAPGEVFFLDSLGGEADNAGEWVITERLGSQELRTAVSARTHVAAFEPAKVAWLNLGNLAGTWRVSAAWGGARKAPTSYPGAFLVYSRPDGVRDFAVVGPSEPTTLQARGYVYGFFITQGDDRPDGDLKLTLERLL